MIRNLPPTLLLLALGFAATSAYAQDGDFEDDDDFTFEGDSEEADDSSRLEEGDNLDSVDDSGDDDLDNFEDPLDDEENEEDNGDLLGEEAPTVNSGDSSRVYRDVQDSVKTMGPDEEMAVWETYLEDYPNTPFRERIRDRTQTLQEALYSQRIGSVSGAGGDAQDQEIKFADALQLENIDPRTRFQAGFEWGLPAYINLFVDYEHALSRKFSLHAGARRRDTGYSVEPGVHWAVVKSARTNTLVTLIGDLHFNATPSWLGVRPQIAFGKRMGKTDFQMQMGPDLELRNPAGVRVVGGMAAHYAASDNVKVFLETHWSMKDIGRSGGFYRFNTASFGMKFFPKKNGDDVSEDLEVNMGATVPYSRNYWSYHQGSVMASTNFYL